MIILRENNVLLLPKKKYALQNVKNMWFIKQAK